MNSLLNAPNNDGANQEVSEYKSGPMKGYKLVTGCQENTCQTGQAGIMLDPDNHATSAVLLKRLCSSVPEVGCKKQSNVMFVFRPEGVNDAQTQPAQQETASKQKEENSPADDDDDMTDDEVMTNDDYDPNTDEDSKPDPLDAERELLM